MVDNYIGGEEMLAGKSIYELFLDMGLPVIGVSILVFMGLISLTINYIYPKFVKSRGKKQSRGITGKSENINSNQNKIA